MTRKTTPPPFPGNHSFRSPSSGPDWKREVAGKSPQDVLDGQLSAREKIDMLLALEAYDEIAQLDGVNIVDVRQNWMEGSGHYTCTSYVFGKRKYVDWVRDNENYKHPEGYSEIGKPEKGDIVFYFHDGAPKHVGIYDGDNMVRSKFGEGHVYRHPIALIPTFYGEPRFFRKNK